jgi:hypothetical protein
VTARRPFFLASEGSEDYRAVREGRNPLCVSVRDFIEEMWPLCSEFLDSDVRQKARKEFHQRWWEVYLTYSLLGASVQLERRECRKPKKSGPDLLSRIAGRSVWIEAVTASAGEGPDAVRRGGSSKGPKSLQDKEIMLRFQQAFSEKVRKYSEYVMRDGVSTSEGYVVALNGGLAEGGFPCTQRFPRIVSALLLGLEIESVMVEFDGATSRFGEAHFEYQPELEKKSKNTVRLAAFLDPANSCVSAVLYSASDPYNCSPMRGLKSRGSDLMAGEFVLVLNPHARVPLPPGFLSAIPRYWVELHDDSLTLHLPPYAVGFQSGGP